MPKNNNIIAFVWCVMLATIIMSPIHFSSSCLSSKKYCFDNSYTFFNGNTTKYEWMNKTCFYCIHENKKGHCTQTKSEPCWNGYVIFESHDKNDICQYEMYENVKNQTEITKYELGKTYLVLKKGYTCLNDDIDIMNTKFWITVSFLAIFVICFIIIVTYYIIDFYKFEVNPTDEVFTERESIEDGVETKTYVSNEYDIEDNI